MEHKQQLKERMYDMLAQGVRVFPKTPEMQMQLDIKSCNLCALSKTRDRVVVAPVIEHKEFFVLSDFPHKEDELSQDVFSMQSSSQILLNLVQKLGIAEKSYLSYALKCVPEKGFSGEALSVCVKHNLAFELRQVQPKVIFCFGHRALMGLVQLDPLLSLSDCFENQGSNAFSFANRKIPLFFLSSSQDLKNHPLWRSLVWKQLQSFQQVHEA